MLRECVARPCSISDIKAFIETHHYYHSINGMHVSYCFKLLYKTRLIGAMTFGKLSMMGVWKKYAEYEEDVVELNRLCCIDNTPKNAESYFIGKVIRWLRDNTSIITIISYADPNYGHTGTIYRASNFEYLGQTAEGKVIEYLGKLYHDKSLRTKYRGKIKPFGQKLRQAIKIGEAKIIDTVGKHIYRFTLYRRGCNNVKKKRQQTLSF